MKTLKNKQKQILIGMLLFFFGIGVGVAWMYMQQRSPSKDTEPIVQEEKQTTEKNESTIPAWVKEAVYVGGDKVLYENRIYKAKWWTQGEVPGKADVWEDTLEALPSQDKEDKENTSLSKSHLDTGETKLVGYFPAWKRNQTQYIRYDLLTDIIYAFAIPTADGNLRPLENPDTATAIIADAHKKDVRVLLGVGGWSYQDVPLESTFMSATSTSEKMHAFADAIVSMCDTYGFDGIDMDWEHPRVDGSSARQYEEFMLYLGEQLHAQGKLLTCALLSGATADGNIYYDAAAHSDAVLNIVDRIHVMAYDGGDGERHSTLAFAKASASYWKDTRKVPKEKIILGVPFYARPSWASYDDLIQSDAHAADADHILYNGMDVYYNGKATIKEKAAYAKDALGGIMVWEITQDTHDESTSLLEVIGQTLKE